MAWVDCQRLRQREAKLHGSADCGAAQDALDRPQASRTRIKQVTQYRARQVSRELYTYRRRSQKRRANDRQRETTELSRWIHCGCTTTGAPTVMTGVGFWPLRDAMMPAAAPAPAPIRIHFSTPCFFFGGWSCGAAACCGRGAAVEGV